MKLTLRSAEPNKKAPRECFPEDIKAIAPNPALPDPFEFFDPALGTNGRVVTKEDWQARREEIKELAQYYYFGYKQPTPREASKLGTREVLVPETVTIDRRLVSKPGSFEVNLPEGSYRFEFTDFSLRPVMDFKDNAWGDWEGHKELLITTPEHMRTNAFITVTYDGRAAEIKLDALEVPVKGVDTELSGPYPAVLVIGGLPKEQIATLKQNGYAYISMNTGSVYSDNDGCTGAYTELYPKKPGEYELDSGSLMGWAWGISRIIDALENDPSLNIDSSRTAVTGVSRNGKAALIAAAFDERISVAAPCDSGATGLSGFRFKNEGQLLNYNTYNTHCEVNRIFSRNEKPVNTVGGSGHWLSSKARDFIPDNEEKLPFDMHEIAALVAPRSMLAFTGENFEWVNSVSTAVTMAAVKEVYEFLGAGSELALIVRDGGHANQDRDLPFLIAVMDRAFGRADTLSVKQYKSLMSPGEIKALDGNGVIYPDKTYKAICDMNAVPYEISSSYQPWSRPGKYFLWTADEQLTEGFERNITAYSDAPGVRLTLPDGITLYRETVKGEAVFKLTADQAVPGRYKLETSGEDMENRAVYFQGMDINNALRHGLNLQSTSPDGMSAGFTSRLCNREAIEVYITSGREGRRLETGFIDGLSPVYLEAYGVSLKHMHIPEGPFVLTIKNIALKALPGCVFNLSLDLEGYKQPNMYAGGAVEGRVRSLQGEKPSWNSSFLKYGPMPEWPLYPASIEDRGERPEYVKTVSDFDTDVSAGEFTGSSVTVFFSKPVNKNEFGIGFDRIISWELSWAQDSRSVTVRFNQAIKGNVTLYLFRLTDLKGNMLPGPVIIPLRTQ